MIGEVNKLIYNTIVKHNSLYLPGIGSLAIVRHSATISSRNEILPPQYRVEFTKECVGFSIIDAIASEVGVEPSRAEEIYNRWLEKSREGSVVKIDRVGVLNSEVFECDSALNAALNINNEPLTIASIRSRKPLWAVVSLLLVISLGYGAWLYNESNTTITDLVTIVEDSVELTAVDVPIIAVTEVVEQQDAAVADVIDEVAPEIETYDWRDDVNVRHWLVVGSYSNTENAERAIADIVKRMPDAQCNYFKLGSMFAVAVFGSAEMVDCQEYKRTYIKEFPQSWVYTPKRYR